MMVLTVQVSREEGEYVEQVGVIDFDRNVTEMQRRMVNVRYGSEGKGREERNSLNPRLNPSGVPTIKRMA